MPLFDDYCRFMIEDLEGTALEDVPGDGGGPTRYGLTQNDDGFSVDELKAMTIEQAVGEYWKRYWLRFSCNLWSSPADVVFFDCCVNNGGGQAAKCLQRACGSVPDGAIGPNTIAAAGKIPGKVLALAILADRDGVYRRIAAAKPDQAKFLAGWLNRGERVREWIGERFPG